jgi:hypothetical protein
MPNEIGIAVQPNEVVVIQSSYRIAQERKLEKASPFLDLPDFVTDCPIDRTVRPNVEMPEHACSSRRVDHGLRHHGILPVHD